MKSGLHPNYIECKVTCACGHAFVTKSEKPAMQVDICSKCHPFFTGEERFVDKQGRSDKFKQKMAAAEVRRGEEAAKEAERKAKKEAETKQANEPKKSFKQVLGEAKKK
jgi:large subunit ribosomal protein L31